MGHSGKTRRFRARIGVLSVISLIATLVPLGTLPAVAAPIPPEAIVLDTGGADDWTNPNRADLSQMGSVDDGTTISVIYSIDDTDLTSGGEEVQGCSLYDTNGNGEVDYALCHTFSDGVIEGPTLYSCTDGFQDKCKNPAEITNHDAVCTTSTAAPDPFADDPDHQAAGGQVAPSPDTDFLVDCEISTTFVGGGSLINVCTYPAGPPNSDAKDCVVAAGDGFLVVNKVATGGDATFDFTIDGSPTQITTSGGTGTTGIIAVAPDTHTVEETAPAGWQLDSASCDNGDDPISVSVTPGQTVTCTFYNSLQAATLTLVKQVVNDYGTPLAADQWTLSAGDALSGTSGVSGEVLPGTYPLSESSSNPAASEYALTSLDCGAGEVTEVTLAAGDDVTCTFVNTFQAAPALGIDKVVTGVDTAGNGVIDAAGDVIDYQITATNDGNIALTNVTVTDPLLGTLDCTPTQPATLAPGESIVCDGSYTVTQADLDDNGGGDGDIDNTATADSDETGPANDSEAVPLSQTASLAIDKTSATTSISEPGTINYTITAWNTGNVTLTGVTVDDPLLGALSCTWPGADGVLPVGDSVAGGGDTVTCTGSYEASQADIDAGEDIVNTAAADSNETGEVTDDHTVTITQTPNADVEKSADVAYYSAVGDVIDYTISVQNTGNVSLSQADVEATLSDELNGVDVTGDLAGPFTDAAGTNPAAGDLAVDGHWYYTYSYTIVEADVADGSSVTNVVCIDVDGDGTEDCSTVETPLAALAIVKTVTAVDGDENGLADSVGDVIEYQIVVTNTGQIDLSPDVTDLLTQSGVELTLDDPPGLVGPDESQGDDGVMEPTETWTYTAQYTVDQANLDDGGSIVNEACALNVDPAVAEVCSDVSTPIVQLPNATISKTADTYYFSAVGDVIDYTLLVQNTGNVSLSEADLDLVDELNGEVVTLDGPFTDAAGTVAATGDLAPLGVWYFTYSYTVDADDIAAGSVGNVVCLDADGDGDPSCDEVNTPLAALDIVKTVTSVTGGTAGGAVDSAGDVINYQVVVTNTGDVNLTPQMSDVVSQAGVGGNYSLVGPTESLDADGTLQVGETWTFTLQYEVSQANMDNGANIDNQACALNFDPAVAQECSDVTTPIDQNALLEIVKSGTFDAGADGYADPGELITYTFTVHNRGNVTLTGVSVSDPLVGPVTCSAGTIPVGGQITCSATYAVTQADIDDGSVYNLATADSNESGPDDDDHTQPLPQNPAMSVDKTVDQAEISGPTTLTYDITVTNDGNVTMYPSMSDVLNASGVNQAIDLGAPNESMDADGALQVGETWTFQFTYEVTQADIDNGTTILNTVCVSDTPDDDDCDSATTTITQSPNIVIVKTFTDYDDNDGNGEVSRGDRLYYTLTSTNTGNVTLAPVNVVDDLTSDSATCASVAPGGTCVLDVTYVVTQGDVDAGEVTNIGSTDGTPPTGPPVTDTDPEAVDVPQHPALRVDKVYLANADEDGNGEVSLGDTLTYAVKAFNDGNVTLTNVIVDDDLTGDSTTCPSVAPGGVCTLIVAYEVTQGDVDAGRIDNTGTGDSDQTPPDEDDETVPVPQHPSIDALKELVSNADEDGNGEVSLGDTLTYTITATNDGNVTLTDVTVDDDLTGTVDAPCAATLAPNGSCSVDVTYVVTQADVDAGEITNIGTTEGTPPTGPPVTDTDPEEVDVPQYPSIDALKELVSNADEDGNGEVSLGDTLTYTITATNDGNVTLTDVTVDDDLTGTVDAPCAATLAPNGSCSVDVTYVVTQADVDAGEITNIGTTEGTPPTGPPVTDTDPEEVDVPQYPGVEVLKTADPTVVSAAGTDIEYTVTVENTGNVTLDPPSLTDLINDSIPVALTYQSGDVDDDDRLDVGETWAYSGSYTVTQADMDAGVDLVNVACAEDVDGDGVDECGDDTTTIDQKPAHTLVKTFVPDEVGIGEIGIFTLVYTNSGNVTLSNVSITDAVEPILDVQSVAINEGTCPNDDGNDQTITCSVDSLAPGESVTVTVTYLAAPLVEDLVPDTGQTSGSNYVFYFENGYVLYGSTGDGTAYLIDPEGNVTEADVEGRNQDIYFNVPFGGDGFQLHLSCSEVFLDGWGDTGPTELDDPEWRIDAYQVHRFNTNGFFKDCGQTFAPFEVENEAEASATPAGGTLDPNPITAEDTVTLLSIAPIEVTRQRVRRGDVEIQYFNTAYEEIEIDIIRVEWTDDSVLESASYQDGVDLGLAGDSPQQASIDTVMDARSKDWLKLSFDSGDAPEGLTVTIVTSTGSTLIYEFS